MTGPASASALTPAVWCLRPGSVLHWRCFDGDWVVYDSGSGDTHALDRWMALVLNELEAGAATHVQLCETLAAQLAPVAATSHELQEPLGAALQRLLSARLIQPRHA